MVAIVAPTRLARRLSRKPSEPVFKNEKYREYWLRRQRRKRTATLVCTNERMLALTRELVPDFYALLQRDRKLDFLRRGTPRRSEL